MRHISLVEVKAKLEALNQTEYACQHINDCITKLDEVINLEEALTSEDFGKPFDYYKQSK